MSGGFYPDDRAAEELRKEIESIKTPEDYAAFASRCREMTHIPVSQALFDALVGVPED